VHPVHPVQPLHQRATDVVWRLAADRVIVRRVGTADGAMTELHGGAALVWVALDEPGTTADVVRRIARELPDVDRTTLEATVAEALASAVEAGLVQTRSDARQSAT
jgi:hypothetical protein